MFHGDLIYIEKLHIGTCPTLKKYKYLGGVLWGKRSLVHVFMHWTSMDNFKTETKTFGNCQTIFGRSVLLIRLYQIRGWIIRMLKSSWVFCIVSVTQIQQRFASEIISLETAKLYVDSLLKWMETLHNYCQCLHIVSSALNFRHYKLLYMFCQRHLSIIRWTVL